MLVDGMSNRRVGPLLGGAAFFLFQGFDDNETEWKLKVGYR